MTASPSPKTRLARLRKALEGARTLLIVLQNNPDPDAIAAAAALRAIANNLFDVSCSIAHGGAVGRAENQALLRYLGLNTREVAALDPERFDRIAMVDCQPGAGNVTFDAGVRLDIVIDHHPIRRESRSARFTDIRSRFGATSTILYEYLKAARIAIEPPLATALAYGIRSDTQDLGRETTRADVAAFLDLYPLANHRVLGRIMAAPLPPLYFAKLRRALDNALVYGPRVVTYLGELESPEFVAEAADLLLRVEDVNWTMCAGLIDGWLHLSLRTTDRERNAGHIARNLGGRRGFGGGHQALAAAQIPLAPDQQDPRQVRRVVRTLIKRFLRATGSSRDPGRPLCEIP